MSIELIAASVAICGFALETVIVLIGAVWVVASVKSSTDRLGDALIHQGDSIEKLYDWLSNSDDEQSRHGERLAALEAKLEN